MNRSYDYDHVGRLQIAHSGVEARMHITGQPNDGGGYGPYSQHTGYDVWGNTTRRLGWGGINGTYTDWTLAYTNNRRDGLSYDAAGNLTFDSGNYTYDATGQQTNATYPPNWNGYTLQQAYDGDRLRAKKVDNGAVTYYLRSSVLGGQVVAEMNSSGEWSRGYVYMGGQLLAIQQAGVKWVHQDPVTKSQRLTDYNQNLLAAIDLDPWGGETSRSQSSGQQPRKFTTYERDGNGNDQAMARSYHGFWQRFDQPDPYDGSMNLAEPQSFNRYAYVQNDPVNFVDPSGLDDETYAFICPGCSTSVTAELGVDYRLINDGGGLFSLLYGTITSRPLIPLPQDNVQVPEPVLLPDPTDIRLPDPPTGLTHCGVNPITGQYGFTRTPTGVAGNLRPGVGGEGYFEARRRGNPDGHRGLDVSGVSGESPIYANRAGIVTFASSSGDAGNLIIIDHGRGHFTRYGHNSSNSVVQGQIVFAGDQIGIVGQNGNARGQAASEAHVHFAVQTNGINSRTVNPETYLNSPCP